ncbi:MAG: nucleotidyl transferase AbiEii/AbiGii toxin family protein [Candidatus Omnitrophota bacterium]
MKDETIFHLISDIADKNGVSCVLIGGFAVNHYKVTRQTLDVDFLITKEDFERILPLLQNAGYKTDYSQEVFTRLKSNQLMLMDIDFMFVDEDTLSKIIKDGEKINIANKRFIVPSLSNLIALKLHSIKYNPKMREMKDLPDIINLIRINKMDFKSNNFRTLCLKYGTEEIYSRISGILED